MKRTPLILAVVVALLGTVLNPGLGQSRNTVLQKAGLSAEAREAILTVGDDVKKLDKSHEGYVKASQEIDALIAKLLKNVREVSRLSAEAKKSGTAREALDQAIEDMTKMSQSFNIQYLDLQKQMQDENRRYTLVSNIMKTKHDTAKNAINNVR